MGQLSKNRSILDISREGSCCEIKIGVKGIRPFLVDIVEFFVEPTIPRREGLSGC